MESKDITRDAKVVMHKRWQRGVVMGKREQKDERRQEED